MELVLNSKIENALLESHTEEPEPIVLNGGILNSSYKKHITTSPRDPKSLFSVKKRLYKYQLRYSQNIETVLKVSFFAVILLGILY